MPAVVNVLALFKGDQHGVVATNIRWRRGEQHQMAPWRTTSDGGDNNQNTSSDSLPMINDKAPLLQTRDNPPSPWI
jgi:hypothetical protein